jgi:hypothetical protein
MERLKIIVHPLSSDAELLDAADAMQQVLDYLKLLEEVERAIGSPEESFDWKLESASTNTPLTVVAIPGAHNPTVNVDKHAKKAKTEFASGMRKLINDKEVPWWMSPEGLVRAQSIFTRTQNGIGNTEIQIADYDTLAIGRDEADRGIKAVVGLIAVSGDADIGGRIAYGEIEGLMSAAGRYHGRPAISIRTDLYGFVWCPLGGELVNEFGEEHKMREVWEGKTIGVEGKLIYGSGGKLSRIEALKIRIIEAAPPIDLDSVLDPHFTAGLDPVEYLNKLHEGELA